MSQTVTAVDEVQVGAYQAADCLRGRHPWVGELAARIAGSAEDWLDELAGSVLDCAENDRAWTA